MIQKINLLLFVSVFSVIAYAQQDKVVLRNEAFKEVTQTNESGAKETKMVPVGKALPGDEIIYITTFSNTGKEPADNIVITNPVPDHTTYKTNTAYGASTKISYSVDGGKVFAEPEKLLIKDADGSERQATAKEYTHIRWSYTPALQPGEEGTVMFRALIE